jgi:diguanylate cyclase (GGDEF)-like protein/PAS domain S-box-containing protein
MSNTTSGNDDSKFYLDLLRAYFDSANDAIFVLCDERKFLVCNRTTQDWLGATEEELTRHNQRMPITDFFRDEDSEQRFRKAFDAALQGEPQRFECHIHPSSERALWVEMSVSRVNVAAGDMVIVVARDISQTHAQQLALQHQATHDSLTGLPNRQLLQDRLNHIIREARHAGERVALITLYLDRFKDINNTLGHDVGDRLLVQMATRLRQLVERSAFVAREGGDEFAVLMPRADPEQAQQLARRILVAMEQPFEIDMGSDVPLQSFLLGATIGVALFPEHGADAGTLIRHADVAMYQAKRLNSGVALYEPGQDQHSPERLGLLGELRRAISDNELVLHYQPIIDIATRRMTGVEALVRWNHPTRGLLAPDHFVPLAEHTGLIRSLDRWVVQAALRSRQDWARQGIDLDMSVNLSVGSLQDVLIAEWLIEQLRSSKVAAGRLQVEVTESAMMTEPERAVEVLTRLAATGVSIAVDDFGTGYSSLAYLKRLPLHKIKIDKSFVINMAENDDDTMIVHSTIELAHNLNFAVVAEGVENAQSWSLLKALRCDAAQGWHIAKAMPAEALGPWIKTSGWKL